MTERVRLTEPQERFLRLVAQAGDLTPYGAQMRAADRLVDLGLVKYRSNWLGRGAVELTAAGREWLAAEEAAK